MHFFQLDQFAAHLNETFNAQIEDTGVPFVLVEAAPMPDRPVAGQMRAPFSLLFRNESAVLFPQRIYTMRHHGMGEFGIFLVPIARDRSGFIYQALFN
ncbi:DUF6916 family protein [Stenotrophomonas maltophilia]|uniref:DUF6916 family protein n=1 Tax=Stenotrophomonas maltophilia TaxID=40324 RepID=UPI0039C0EE7D